MADPTQTEGQSEPLSFNNSSEVPCTATRSSPTSTQNQGPSYVPQFSTTNTLIIDRLKRQPQNSEGPPSDASQPDTVTGNDVGNRILQSTNTTLAMPRSTHAASQATFAGAWSAGSVPLDAFIHGVKRKSGSTISKVDFAQNTVPFPWVPAVQTSNVLAKSQDEQKGNVTGTCSSCAETLASSQNLLVACSRCANVWHQNCHSPTITGEAIKSSNFVCSACDSEQDTSIRLKGKVDQQRLREIEKLRERRLATLPKDVRAAKPELVGFGARGASDLSRTEYFSGMKKTDLLNVLSLCDQLKPHLIVDILVSVSKKHPDLPIFNSPDWEANVPSASRSNTIVISKKHDVEKPRHGHSILNKAKQRPKAMRKILKRTRVIEVMTDIPDEEGDVLPPTWARAGEGLYAKLAPETEDRGFLLDENDEESFSHFLVDGFGQQIVEPAGA
ncbi:hypothetical protein G7046_g1923 [Stylonectria norvegica]|nr:hypothetical protein G7046_g1923 [Stylonectria norvegica]